MAKFNDYLIHAEDVNGSAIIDGTVTALGLEQAWHKAVSAAFEAIKPSTGAVPETITVSRLSKPSEHQG